MSWARNLLRLWLRARYGGDVAKTTLSKEQQHEMARKSVADMRASFQSRNWNETLSIHEKFKDLRSGKGLRVEAACLAVRALVAMDDRRSAKEILNTLYDAEYHKAAHYVALAYACLDMKQYGFAARACERAESLRMVEDAAKKSGAVSA
jgi:hypothetical protein